LYRLAAEGALPVVEQLLPLIMVVLEEALVLAAQEVALVLETLHRLAHPKEIMVGQPI
jgi:hypothetical protein